MKIRIEGADGVSIRIEVSIRRGSSVDAAISSSGVTKFIGDGAGARTLRIASKERRRRGLRDRIGGDPVSPEMEAAAVEASLGSADVVRLGRSPAEVYRAMDVVRLGGFYDDPEGS